MGRKIQLTHFLGLVFLIFVSSLQSQEKSLNFFELSRADGLSNNNITAITKDRHGYLWFGTINGLNRYNGYSFVNYYASGEPETGLPGNYISALQTDHQGRLWIGCFSNGLARYDEHSGCFIRYDLSPDELGSDEGYVNDIEVDRQGNIWVATTEGLFMYKEQLDEFEKIPVIKTENSFSGITGLYTLENSIYAISADDDNGIWIAYSGWEISYLSRDKNLSRHYDDLVAHKVIQEGVVNDFLFFEGKLYLAADNHEVMVYDIMNGTSGKLLNEDIMETATGVTVHDGTIWITCWNGVVRYESETAEYFHYQTDPANPKSLKSGATNALFIDNSGILWLGAGNIGINYTILSIPIGNLHENEENEEQLFHPNVSSVLYDSKGNLWVAFQSGLMQMYPKGETVRQIIPVDPLIPGTGVGHIFTIFESSDGSIYISSWQGGVHRFDDSKKRFVRMAGDYNTFVEKFGGIDIRAVTEGDDGSLWFAVFRRGVARYDPVNGDVRLYGVSDESGGISGRYVYDVEFDEMGNLWASAINGLNRLPPGDTYFVNYLSSEETGGLPNDSFLFSFLDQEGRMWFISNGGLSLYNPVEDSFISIVNETFGFPDMVISTVEQDEAGNLWLATCSGIIKVEIHFDCKYCPRVNDFFVYGINHGILSDDFFSRSSTSDERGRLYFGGTRGIDFFQPADIKYKDVSQIMQIEEMRIPERKIFSGSGSDHAFNEEGTVMLSHGENMISFEYVALNFIETPRNRYFYKLEPFHADWHYAGFDRSVNFTNLPPGAYTFRVKSCLTNTICDSEEAYINFFIRPPFWQTNLFVVIVAVLFVFLMFAIQTAWSSNIRKKKIALQKLVDQRTLQLSQKNHELTEKSRYLAEANNELSSLNSMKDKFFSIIAHDLRSPLSVLAGFSDIILYDYEKYDDKKRKELIGIIHDSVNKTVQLLDNLLHWANSQTNRLVPKNEKVFPENVADEVYSLHKELFINKDISFSNQISPDLKITTDNEMLRVILRNLLTNSVKFTPPGGKVIIKASGNGSHLIRFDITDTGKGIPDEIKDELFSINFTTSSSGTEGETGTGLGLILCHEFITKMGGDIWVEETSDKGTTFSFTLLSRN